MAGSRSRDKGARFERIVCKAFRDTFGGEWRRTSGGESQRLLGDVMPLEWDTFPFSIECKVSQDDFLDSVMAGEGPVHGWWNQTVDQAGETKLPLLVCKRDRYLPYAIVDYDGWLWVNAHNHEPLHMQIQVGKRLRLMLFSDFLALLWHEKERREGGDLLTLVG